MVRCPTEVELERFLAGTTSDDEGERVRSHLDGCPACRGWVDEASRDDQLVPVLRAGLRDPLPGPVDAAGALPAQGPPKYRIVRRLGAGGMGVVFEAEQEHPRRTVALKVLSGASSPRAVRRFEVEAEALARLDHEGIARIHEAGVFEGPEGARPFLAMELVRGRPLQEYLRQEGPSLRDRLRLFLAIADAVEHAHQKGVVHRDLKPGNVLVRPDGRPKVLDFGVARLSGKEGGDAGLRTQAGQLLGTVAYMSPEQGSGDPKAVDTRTDVYALGVVLYEMLTGELPYDVRGKGTAEMLRAIEESEPVPPRSRTPAMARDLDTVVLKALEKDPNRRYGSAADLAEDVRRYLRHEPITARPAGALERGAKFARRNRTLVGGAALVLAVLVAGLVSTSRQAGRALQAEGEARRQLGRSETVVGFLRLLLGGSDGSSRARRAGYTLREALDEASDLLESELEQDPDVEADLRVTLGNAYASLALFEPAEQHLVRALALRRASSGTQGVPVAECLNSLGSLRWQTGRTAEARELFEEALRIYAAELAPGDLRAATTRINLGHVFLRMRDLDGAEEALGAALEVFESSSTGSENHAAALTGMAQLQLARGNDEAAAALQERALAMYREALGDDHPSTLLARALQARRLSESGRHDDAVAILRDVLPSLERFHGPRHPEVARTQEGLALCLLPLGELDEAEAALRRALETRRKLSLDAAALARTLSILADVLERKHDHGGAAAALGEAVELRERLLPGSPQVTVGLELRQARMLHRLGRVTEARELYEEVADHDCDDLELAAWQAEACRHLGSLLWNEGRPEEAAERFGQALEHYAAFDPDHWKVQVVESGMAVALLDLNRLEEAEDLLRGALEALEHDPSVDRPVLLRLRGNLAATLRIQGRLTAARELLAEVIEEGEGIGDLDELFLAGPRNNLANVLCELGDHAEAESLARRALTTWNTRLGPRHPNTLAARKTLAAILLSSGRTDEAREELDSLLPHAREALAGHPQRLGDVLSVYGRVLVAAGDFVGAERALEESRALLVRVRAQGHPSVREVDEILESGRGGR